MGWDWEDFDAAIEEAVDASDNDVVIRIRNAARGRSSGALVEFHFGQVWTVSNGKVVRLRAFPNFEDALEAVGLWE